MTPQTSIIQSLQIQQKHWLISNNFLCYPQTLWHNCPPVKVFHPPCCYSAGVGRTGSLIAIDVELQRAQKEGVVDPFNYILKMRDQRNLIIQTEVCTTFVVGVTSNFQNSDPWKLSASASSVCASYILCTSQCWHGLLYSLHNLRMFCVSRSGSNLLIRENWVPQLFVLYAKSYVV